MKKIEEQMLEAFNSNKNFTCSNTIVKVDGNETKVFLFGNLICRKVGKKIQFSKAGWNSVTTRNRLVALGCDCRMRNGKLEVVNGKFDF